MHTASAGGPFLPFFFRLCKLLKVPAKFVFVFDGPHRPPVKRGVLVNTTSLWYASSVRRNLGGNPFSYGHSYAPGEAEAEMAKLNCWGSMNAVCTKDADALVFGATTRGNTDNVKKLSAPDIAQKVGFTHSRLFLYALAAGGDYDSGISNCGCAGASELALSGVGDSLFRDIMATRSDEEREALLEGWRDHVYEGILNKTIRFGTRLNHNLLSDLQFTDFPPLEVVNNYANPATSATFPDYHPNTRNWRVGHEEPNPSAIIQFCRDRLGWKDSSALLKVLRDNLWEGLVLRMIYSVSIRTMP
ncbi:hypothetical protein FA13DRAFT_1634328 [Coprinellus micaceus]|uniref:XPG-I domain-containing protein n=1 Tax=Coprinellus micaceus TaxID=71717 RepID=A0A4Y7T299_COPMI|nr:hypothetical protein FA13DRAFT_1634328 [Coprinellus micaceus]